MAAGTTLGPIHAHYLCCAQLRGAVEMEVGDPGREPPLLASMAMCPGVSDAQRAQGAQRMVAACLTYLWVRAMSPAAGERCHIALLATWVADLSHIVREVAAAAPLVPRRRAALRGLGRADDRKGQGRHLPQIHTSSVVRVVCISGGCSRGP